MRRITVAITVDERMGIAFNKKRQSRDSKLIEDLVNCADGDIYVTSYSNALFGDYQDKVKVVTDPLSECPDRNVCFIEVTDISAYEDEIEKLIIYRWNRHYPSDKKLDIDLSQSSFALLSSNDFEGSSHEIITRDIYINSRICK